MSQEEHVDLGFPVELEDPEDEVPQAEGLIVALGLEDPPVVREALLDEGQVVPLEVLEGRVLDVLQPPQGRELKVLICRGGGTIGSNCRAPQAWPDSVRYIGPPVRGTRTPRVCRRSMKSWTMRWWGRRRRRVRIRRCRARRRWWGLATVPTSVIVLRTRHCKFSRNRKDLEEPTGSPGPK